MNPQPELALDLPGFDSLGWRKLLDKPLPEPEFVQAVEATIETMRLSAPADSPVHASEWADALREASSKRFESERARYERYSSVELGFLRLGSTIADDWHVELSAREAEHEVELEVIRDAQKDVPKHPCHLLGFQTSEFRAWRVEFHRRVLNATLRDSKHLTFGGKKADLMDDEERAKVITVLINLQLAERATQLAIAVQKPNLDEFFR